MNKLVKAFFGLLLLTFSSQVMADYNAPVLDYMYNGRSIYFKDPSTACACATGQYTNGNTSCTNINTGWTSLKIDAAVPPNCIITFPSGGTSTLKPSLHWHCPYGGSLTYTGQIWVCKGADPPPSCAAPGSPLSNADITTAFATGSKPGSALAQVIVGDGQLGNAVYCSSGCLIKPNVKRFNESGSCKVELDPGPNGYFRVHCDVPMDSQGSECTPSDGSSPLNPNGPYPTLRPPSEPSKVNNSLGRCPEGTSPAGTDSYGLTICAGNPSQPSSTSQTSTTKPATTVTDSAGNTVKTEISTSSNSDGSTTTTTKTTTTTPAGEVTVAVKQETTKAPTGSQGVKDSPNDVKDLCQRNPSLNICKNSQVLGSCEQISCEGDAIQCATLRAAAAMQCQQKRDRDQMLASKEYANGQAVMNGTDGSKEGLAALVKGTEIDIGSIQLDKNGWIGGGACIADKNFTVFGKSVTVSFAKLCDNILPLRVIIMFIASVVVFRLYMDAFKTLKG